MTNHPESFALLNRWPVGDLLAQLVSWEPLQGNVLRIDSADGRHYVLKEIGAYTAKIAQRLRFEHSVLSHVVATGVAAAVPLLTSEGEPYTIHDGQIYRLSHWLPNRMAEIKTKADEVTLYANYGRAIAYFHQALAGYKAPNLLEETWQTDLRKRILDEAIPVVRAHLDAAQTSHFEEALSHVLPTMEETVDELPKQLMIWDCHPGNVAVDGLAVSGFIDLDHLAVAPRVLDLADFLVHLVKWDLGNEAKQAQWLAHFPHLLRAYETVSPLTTAERAALYPAMVGIPLIFMDFFFQNGHEDLTKTELTLFHWLIDQRQSIAEQLRLMRNMS